MLICARYVSYRRRTGDHPTYVYPLPQHEMLLQAAVRWVNKQPISSDETLEMILKGVSLMARHIGNVVASKFSEDWTKVQQVREALATIRAVEEDMEAHIIKPEPQQAKMILP